MSRTDLDIFAASPANIWNYRQNHPELVCDDCRHYGLTEDQIEIVRRSMMARGINKWLKVRRDLIAYKKQIRHEIKRLNEEVRLIKVRMNAVYAPKGSSAEEVFIYMRDRAEYERLKERLKVLMDVRGKLKALCMTERWQVWQGMELKDMNSIKASDEEPRR